MSKLCKNAKNIIATIPYSIYRQKPPLFSLPFSISFHILFFNKKLRDTILKDGNFYGKRTINKLKTAKKQ